jgi:3',5'-nucleoside bisphosphate phosphatase
MMDSNSLPPRVAESDAVDLHLHTRAYDGLWTPEKLVEAVAEKGLKAIAVCDHDTVVNVRPTRELAAARGIAVLPAVEVTSRFENQTYHLLLYNVDVEEPALIAVIGDVRGRQIESAERGLEALRRRGFTLPHLDAIVAGRELMPLYVVIALLKAGYGKTAEGAMRVAEEAGMSFLVAADMARTITVAHRQGALAILAHPGRKELGIEPAKLPTVERMLDIGLDGLEVYHPLHSAEDIVTYGDFAAARNLLVSCGSDSHGPTSRTNPTAWPVRFCRRLLEASGFTVEEEGD